MGWLGLLQGDEMNSNSKKILGKRRQSQVTEVIFSNNQGTRERKIVGRPPGYGTKIDSAALRRASGKKPMSIANQS